VLGVKAVMEFSIRPVEARDKPWIRVLLEERWEAPIIVTRGRVHRADELPGLVAEEGGNPVGLITYKIRGDECEVVSLDSLMEGRGMGTRLLECVEEVARKMGCKRVWVITTNDNTPALRFYQKRGFRLVAVYRNALEESRKLKPQIPLTGLNGIPLRDEIELEKMLN